MDTPYKLRVDAVLLPYCEREGAALGVSPYVHLHDFMFAFAVRQSLPLLDVGVRGYFVAGRERTLQLADLVYGTAGRDRAGKRFTLFEFASGYGMMTRHFAQVLPNADVACCDIHADAVEFLDKVLQIPALLSSNLPQAFPHRVQADVICAMSFFSHMPPATWGGWFEILYDALRPGGSLIFSTHGRHYLKGTGLAPDIPPEGFFFQPGSEQLDLDPAEYGAMFVSREWVAAEIYKRRQASVSFFGDAHWAGAQDTYVVMKPL